MIWIRVNRTSAITARTLLNETEDTVTFLFDDCRLIDLTPRARALMSHGDSMRSDWENLLSLLSARFPHMRSQCSDLASVGKKTIAANDSQSGWIEAEYWNGLARITLVQDQNHPDETLDPLSAEALEHELETLRSIGEDSPQLIWKRDAEGVLVWANRAYIELSEAIHPVGPQDILPWPPRAVFDDPIAPEGTAPLIDMQRVDVPDSDDPIWYEVTSLRRGTDTIHFAVDATAVVAAREAQRTFVQTLTKTFAQLSVALAIFDEDRRLVLFNPALVDLTNLPAEFLINRPTLFSVLDRLRDQNMIPEPKNYKTWRDQVAALEAAAEQGNYHETWSLPNGQTFRVTGNPHPNGAIAVLIEDISDEVSLTRKYRSQIDVTTATIDNLVVPVAVFSSSGSLIMANSAYRQLWGNRQGGSLSNQDFVDEMETWQAMSAPSPVWLKLKETMSRRSSDAPWDGRIWLDNHIEVTCHYAPLPDGNHQVTFVPSSNENQPDGQIEPLKIRESQSLTS
ncbi:PAS-domain containing protein [Octadecabacter sp. 1_MG-2023]|uniref:PAS-domain containing protein n=1 Tax=unclassified Octadecabacter TaxID=196158 RepID=UPI001C08FA41|nr:MULTISPECIES: PAS-domain containing protein [unclassified Octadecabacter]MBU2992332.1 PAS-domain containing protein [Octadecabacter sp. B2R22]MDO6734911.1 PAS-domain containing protein [Octadecabacter sp. 1_MG-2023]